jgi:Holliday junction resolvase RusA-like endonuclease
LPSLWIAGTFPSKKNSQRIVLGRGRKPTLLSSTDYIAWEKQAILEFKVGWDKGTIKKCVSITYQFTFPDKRVRDLSNAVEGINDALVHAGVLKDDNWKVTGNMILKPSLALNPSDVGCHITFNVEEYE